MRTRVSSFGVALLFGVAVLAYASTASAAIATFTNRALWQAAITTPLVTEGLEDDPVGLLTLPQTLLGSGLTVDLVSGRVTAQIADCGSSSCGYWPATAGDNVLAFGDTGDSGDYTVSFTGPVPMSAFGFDISGFQPETFGSGGFLSSFYLSGSPVGSLFVPSSLPSFTGTFFGFVNSASFDELRLTFTSNIGDADFVGFDQIQYAPVPEPGTLLLIGTGLGGMALRRRRRTS
jgi:hypothetical protein